jgi:magnesium-transporting ATPase (P-type)
MDVLCVDKTGTITLNQLAVTGVIPLEQATESDVLFAGALASQEANQDPIDLAFLAAAQERHLFRGVPAVMPVSFTPFEAKNRRTEAIVEQNGQRLRVMKGAVRTVAQACGLQPPAIEALEARVSASAQKGYRTLAVARGPETGAPALVGLVTLYDPLRPDATQLIATLHALGIAVKMLTGDALAVASEIARGVGLPNIRRVTDLKAASAQAGNEAVDLLAGTDGFAEVFPEDKYLVVQHLQAAGHVTGMTGDGVNDAPALKKADIGVAMGLTGTDVSREAAAMTLTDDNFASIVAAIEEGRRVFGNVKKYLMYLLSCNIGEIGLMAAASFMGLPLPLTTVQILYVNLATDGLPALALAVDPPDPDLMTQPPRDRRAGLFSRPVVTLMVLGGLWATVVNIGLFFWALSTGRPEAEARTVVFTSIVLIEFFKAYSFRSDRLSVLHRPFANKWLNLAIVWELLLLAAILFYQPLSRIFGLVPMDNEDLMMIALVAFTILPVLETGKWFLRRSESRRRPSASPA